MAMLLHVFSCAARTVTRIMSAISSEVVCVCACACVACVDGIPNQESTQALQGCRLQRYRPRLVPELLRLALQRDLSFSCS